MIGRGVKYYWKEGKVWWIQVSLITLFVEQLDEQG